MSFYKHYGFCGFKEVEECFQPVRSSIMKLSFCFNREYDLMDLCKVCDDLCLCWIRYLLD